MYVHPVGTLMLASFGAGLDKGSGLLRGVA
jgi:hypothetical protein